ncbi:hypothetical protein MBLNU230_g3746t1 [Neophaeotheca triangularis]
MLHVKSISEFLTKNTDPRLCKRWYIITPNGTLLANSLPTDARDLRRQTALVALAWQEHQPPERNQSLMDESEPRSDTSKPALETLTIESWSSNVIATLIQPQLLLVLEGGVPPRRKAFEQKTTPEFQGDSAYPNLEGDDLGSSTSLASKASSVAGTGVLRLHRKRLNALAASIAEQLERTGFSMPEESPAKLF